MDKNRIDFSNASKKMQSIEKITIKEKCNAISALFKQLNVEWIMIENCHDKCCYIYFDGRILGCGDGIMARPIMFPIEYSFIYQCENADFSKNVKFMTIEDFKVEYLVPPSCYYSFFHVGCIVFEEIWKVSRLNDVWLCMPASNLNSKQVILRQGISYEEMMIKADLG